MKKLLAGAMTLLMLFTFTPPLWAQDDGMMVLQKEPPMRNIFFNVLWGSVAGGMGYMSLSVFDSNKTKEEKYAFNNLTNKFIIGATGGGVVGLAFGAYFSLSDITFDPNQSRISHNLSLPALPDERPSQSYAQLPPLFAVNFKF